MLTHHFKAYTVTTTLSVALALGAALLPTGGAIANRHAPRSSVISATTDGTRSARRARPIDGCREEPAPVALAVAAPSCGAPAGATP